MPVVPHTHTHTTCIRPPRQKAVESKNAKEFEVPQLHLMACANHEVRCSPLRCLRRFCIGGPAPHVVCLPFMHSILPKRGRSAKDCSALLQLLLALRISNRPPFICHIPLVSLHDFFHDKHQIPSMYSARRLHAHVHALSTNKSQLVAPHMLNSFGNLIGSPNQDRLRTFHHNLRHGFQTHFLAQKQSWANSTCCSMPNKTKTKMPSTRFRWCKHKFVLSRSVYAHILGTYFLTFCLTYLLTFFLTSFWRIFCHSFWQIFWHSFWWHSFWHIFLTYLSPFFLTYLLTFLTYLLTYLSDISSISSDILFDISSDILSDISFDILSAISSGISPDILWDISFDILSDISSGILFDISFWHISWHSFRHIFWHSYWHIFWHSFWLIFWHSSWHIFWHSFWHIFWHSFWHIFWHSFWHLWGPGRHTELTGSRLGSGPPHWTHRIAVELAGSRLGSGTPHWTHELAVGARHATLNSQDRSWDPTRRRTTGGGGEGGEGEGGEVTDIKSNNPHLTGGEPKKWFVCVWSIPGKDFGVSYFY